MTDKIRVGVIGCGNIAGPYTADIKNYPELELVGVADIDQTRADEFGAKHNVRVFESADALINSSEIDLCVNLTVHHAHKAVSTQCLNAGKHVYSEKPLALTYAEAHELVDLAKSKGLRMGCSPFTLMGEAQQTAWKLIRDGRLGTIRLAYAEVNWGRIESWHPAPGPFYEVGALFDVGVYPLTILISLFGRAKRLQAYGKVLYSDRVTKEGVPFHISTPDYVTTMIEMENGMVIRLTTNFYVGHHNKQTGIEFHCDLGSVHLLSWQNFNARVQFAEFGGQYDDVTLVKEPYQGTPWARGLWETSTAILQNRPHRFTGELAAHVVEILEAAARSMKDEKPVELTSHFTAPTPMEWAL